MPLYLRYSVSIADAVRVGTTQAGEGYHALSSENVVRLRDQALGEVAFPYLRTTDPGTASDATALTEQATLALDRPTLPEAMFEALARRRDRLEHVRRVAALAETPSWENLGLLVSEDASALCLEYPPHDVALALYGRTDETTALSLVYWARALARVVRAEEERAVPDAYSLTRLLEGDEQIHPAARRLLAEKPGRSRLDWLPGDVRAKLQAFWEKQAKEADAQRAREAQELAERNEAARGRARTINDLVRECGTIRVTEEISQPEHWGALFDRATQAEDCGEVTHLELAERDGTLCVWNTHRDATDARGSFVRGVGHILSGLLPKRHQPRPLWLKAWRGAVRKGMLLRSIELQLEARPPAVPESTIAAAYPVPFRRDEFLDRACDVLTAHGMRTLQLSIAQILYDDVIVGLCRGDTDTER